MMNLFWGPSAASKDLIISFKGGSLQMQGKERYVIRVLLIIGGNASMRCFRELAQLQYLDHNCSYQLIKVPWRAETIAAHSTHFNRYFDNIVIWENTQNWYVNGLES